MNNKEQLENIYDFLQEQLFYINSISKGFKNCLNNKIDCVIEKQRLDAKYWLIQDILNLMKGEI